ncbi:PREDICTED: odorant-binding protein 2b-like isoform X2 [Chinchilla lanigera]|uniref:odorant-binding protein 2b-like isoform X2 n=1 Tax=Chinchilla lanigera TaxID=34839 RepID=UPI00038EA898|nr:PREDICTED: odorant-binding protein 2b-like isoform X2 [Chinchilla lanigera]
MKTLLLTFVLLGVVAALPAEGPLSFLSKELDVTGTWYLKAMVANKNLSEEDQPKKAFPVMMTTLEGGDVEAKITYVKKGRCYEEKVLLHKAQEPGKYSAYQGKMSINIEETSVRDHILFYTEHVLHGKMIRIGSLMGRTPEENPEALEEFEKFTQHKGLPQDSFIPEQKENCVPEYD